MFLVSDFISLFRYAQLLFADIHHNSTEKCPLPQETANDTYAKNLLVLEHKNFQSSNHLKPFKKCEGVRIVHVHGKVKRAGNLPYYGRSVHNSFHEILPHSYFISVRNLWLINHCSTLQK